MPHITLDGNTLISNHSTGNQWLLDGVELKGATSSTFQPGISGEYQLIVTNQACTLRSTSVAFVITDLVEQSAGVLIYPNPTKKQITIAGLKKYPVSYSIFSQLGQTVKSGVLVQSSESTLELSLDLVPGVYFLKLMNSHRQFYHKLVVE